MSDLHRAAEEAQRNEERLDEWLDKLLLRDPSKDPLLGYVVEDGKYENGEWHDKSD